MSYSDEELHTELERARALAADGLQGEALILLRKIAHDRPDEAEAHYLIAALLLNQKAYDEALDAVEHCLQLDPEHSRAKKVRDACQEALSARTSERPITSLQPGTYIYEARKTKVTMRRCPSCGEEIVRGARLCRHCGVPVGMSPWLRTITAWLMGAGLIVVLLYFLFSVVGRRSLDPVFVRADGTIVESPSAEDKDVVLRIDRLQWYPGSILPAPIPTDSGDQMYNMSHGTTCSGWVTNVTEEYLAYAVVYAHFSGRAGTHFGSAESQVMGLAPGQSKSFSMSARLGNRASRCTIAVGELEFGERGEELAQAADVAPPSEGRGFPWLRFVLMCILSSMLLFAAARLQLACNARIPWDYELKADAVASVLAIPFIVLANALLLFYVYGLSELARRGIILGPIAGLAVLGPLICLILILVFFFKRGFWGTAGIIFFYGCLYLCLLRLIG